MLVQSYICLLSLLALGPRLNNNISTRAHPKKKCARAHGCAPGAFYVFRLWSLYFSLYFIFRSMDRLHKPFQNTDIILHTDLARFFSTKTHSFFSSSFVYFGFYFLATARFLCASTNSPYKFCKEIVFRRFSNVLETSALVMRTASVRPVC